MMTDGTQTVHTRYKTAISPETFVFPTIFFAIFYFFARVMGLANALNTIMNTAYDLLLNTVLYIMAICVIMGAVSAMFSEFGFVTLINKLLQPLMQPVWGLPGAASLAIVTTFLSDNPAVLTLADDSYYRHFFKKYQLPALTNLGTAFGMGLIVCTFMLGQSAVTGVSYGLAVAIGLLGAIIGSVVSTRIMLRFTRCIFGAEAVIEDCAAGASQGPASDEYRPVRSGSIGTRLMGAILAGGQSGVRMGIDIIPGVLVICTVVMMLTNGSAGGFYTGGAYEGIALLPAIADKVNFILQPMFGFSSPECISVPITALGAAGAAIGVVPGLLASGQANACDVAVFTAMCMCWSGYLSTHVSMMTGLKCKELIGKAIVSHTIGGICAGMAAHYLFLLASAAM